MMEDKPKNYEWCKACHMNVLPEIDGPVKVCPNCHNAVGRAVE